MPESGAFKASVEWTPTPNNLMSVLGGQFLVLYDLEWEGDGGQIQVNDGFFIHHFVPQKIPFGSKTVFFAIPTPESIVGERLDAIKVGLLPQSTRSAV